MDIMGFKKVLRNLIPAADGTDIADPGPGGFLHHVSQLSGQHQLALPRHDVHLDLERISAHTRPCQPPDDPYLVRIICHLIGILLFPKILLDILLRNGDFFPVLCQDFLCGLPAHISDLPLQLPDPGLLRIILRHFPDSLPAECQHVRGEPVLLQLLRNQMLRRNVKLFILRIAAHLHYLHTVQKGPRNGLQRIGRSHEEHLRQIQRHLQVMIPESAVLLAVQHLQQCREGVSLIVCTDLVNFIQKKQRIFHSRHADAVGDPSRHGSYIGLPVSPDLRLVPNPAQGNAYIGLFKRPRQGLRNGSLAGSRRSCQTEDRAFSLFRQSPHRKKFQYPLFDLLQSVVILLQHLLGKRKVRAVLRSLVPWHLQDRLNIGTQHTALCRTVQGALKTADLLCQLILHFFGRLQLFGCLFKFLRVGQGGIIA